MITDRDLRRTASIEITKARDCGAMGRLMLCHLVDHLHEPGPLIRDDQGLDCACMKYSTPPGVQLWRNVDSGSGIFCWDHWGILESYTACADCRDSSPGVTSQHGGTRHEPV